MKDAAYDSRQDCHSVQVLNRVYRILAYESLPRHHWLAEVLLKLENLSLRMCSLPGSSSIQALSTVPEMASGKRDKPWFLYFDSSRSSIVIQPDRSSPPITLCHLPFSDRELALWVCGIYTFLWSMGETSDEFYDETHVDCMANFRRFASELA